MPPIDPVLVIVSITGSFTFAATWARSLSGMMMRHMNLSGRMFAYSLFMLFVPLMLRTAVIRRALVTKLSFYFFPFARAPVDIFALCIVVSALVMTSLDSWLKIARFFWISYQWVWHAAFTTEATRAPSNSRSTRNRRSAANRRGAVANSRLQSANYRALRLSELALDEWLEKSKVLVKQIHVDYVASMLVLWFCHTRLHTFSHALALMRTFFFLMVVMGHFLIYSNTLRSIGRMGHNVTGIYLYIYTLFPLVVPLLLDYILPYFLSTFSYLQSFLSATTTLMAMFKK